jgi:hypothetical protein
MTAIGVVIVLVVGCVGLGVVVVRHHRDHVAETRSPSYRYGVRTLDNVVEATSFQQGIKNACLTAFRDHPPTFTPYRADFALDGCRHEDLIINH